VCAPPVKKLIENPLLRGLIAKLSGPPENFLGENSTKMDKRNGWGYIVHLRNCGYCILVATLWIKKKED
jgi:hypothetical protein